MAVAYQSFASASSTAGTPITVTKPSGTVSGDGLVAFVLNFNPGSAITPPSGWTLKQGTSTTDAIYEKTAGGSEPASYAWTNNLFNGGNVLIIRVTGQKAAPFVEAQNIVNYAVVNTSAVIPSVTTSGANRLLFQCILSASNNTWTPPGTATERFDSLDALNFARAGGDETVGSGATGTRTWTPNSQAFAGGFMVAMVASSQNLAVTGFAPAVAFGTTSLRRTVATTGFAPTVAFGTPTLVPDQQVTVTGFTPVVAFGTPTVILDQQLPVTGFTPVVQFGTPTLLPEVTPTGFEVPVVFGTPTLVQDQFLTPDGFEVPILFGDATLTAVLAVDGFTLPVLFGDTTVILDNVLAVTGFTPTIVFGSPDVDRQPFVTATVYDHETGNPLGAGATVQLFDENGTLLDTTTTDAGGDYIFYLPFGFTDNVFTVVRTTIGLTDYQGVSEICSVST